MPNFHGKQTRSHKTYTKHIEKVMQVIGLIGKIISRRKIIEGDSQVDE
jgi:hypothetical protein